MDIMVYIVLLLICGVAAGLMAGFLGVGGGIILTPMQYYLLLSTGVDASLAITISFATSLAVIFVTMISSTRKQLKNNFVVKEHLKPLMILGFIGAVCGAFISTHIDVSLLKTLFGLMCIISVINMILIRYPDNDDNINHSLIAHALLGLFAGLLCGLLGVGGGIIMIPVLTILLKYPTHKAIGTSGASIIATSLGGLISYIILGLNVSNLPAYSLGYVNILQFVFITLSSSIVASYAAAWSKKVDGRILKGFHIIIVFYIGIKMLGFV